MSPFDPLVIVEQTRFKFCLGTIVAIFIECLIKTVLKDFPLNVMVDAHIKTLGAFLLVKSATDLINPGGERNNILPPREVPHA